MPWGVKPLCVSRNSSLNFTPPTLSLFPQGENKVITSSSMVLIILHPGSSAITQ